MEVLQTKNYYIFVKNENRNSALWWNRTTSQFSIRGFFIVTFRLVFIFQMGGFLMHTVYDY